MARIKYTGPSQIVQMQRVSTPHVVGANVPKSAQKERQGQTEANQQILTIQQSQAFKQQQSLEMVQIMLHVSLGTLFYLREFLPLSCFGDRDLKLAHREKSLSYHEFISGKVSSNKPDPKAEPVFGQGKRGQPLKVLIRNREPQADMILDLLEHGIFDALGKNVLEALQITVLLDKDAPQDVVESYTFSFKYTGGLGDVDSRLASVSLESTGCVADMKTMQTARLGLEMIIRRLITLSTFLPILPSRRYLEIHLLYTEDCPPEYEPPGFKRTTDDSIRFPLSDNWCRESQSCGAMDSGYHTVGLKVTSLKWTGPDRDDPENPAQIPHHMEYRDTVLRAEEIGIPLEDTVHDNALRAQSNSQESTQTRQDAVAKQRLQKMIPTVSSTPDSDLVPTQRLDVTVPFGVHSEMPQYYTAQRQVQLSQVKTTEIQQHARSKDVDYIRETGSGDMGTVRCQCGWNGEEPEMVECAFCHTRQHLLCYGFLGSNDARLPDTHACYRCLLEPNETHLLRELNTLVLLRRALEIIIQEGYPNRISIFSQKLHCNGQTVVQVTDLLKKQGFLQATPGNKSKGFLEKGLPKYSIPQSQEVREKIRREIFDPLAKIEHHYIRTPIPESLVSSKPFATEKTAIPYPNESQLRSDECRTNVKDMDELETHTSGDELMDLAEKSRGRKRSLAASESSHLRGSQQQAQLDTETSVSGRRKRSLTEDVDITSTASHRKSQTENISGNKVNSPSDYAEGQIRRSPRKRRKMSNAVKLIDVGAVTTDEESL